MNENLHACKTPLFLEMEGPELFLEMAGPKLEFQKRLTRPNCESGQILNQSGGTDDLSQH